jgi:hypothetical protein
VSIQVATYVRIYPFQIMLVIVEEFEAGAAGTLSVIFCVDMVVVVIPARSIGRRGRGD